MEAEGDDVVQFTGHTDRRDGMVLLSDGCRVSDAARSA